MSKIIYIDDHVRKIERGRQYKTVDKSIVRKIFDGITMANKPRSIPKKAVSDRLKALMRQNCFKQSGFSLVELTVVVAIVGALSVIAIPYYQSFAKKAERVEAHTGLSGMFTMMTIYQLEHDGKGTSDMNQLGFKFKGKPKYSFGFESRVGGDGDDSKPSVANGHTHKPNIPAHGQVWPAGIVNHHTLFGYRGRKTCGDYASSDDCPDDCYWASGGGSGTCQNSRLESLRNKEVVPATGGLSLAKDTFSIGSIRWLGKGVYGTSTDVDKEKKLDILTIDQDRHIGVRQDGIKAL